jgi:hypothetical protein
MTVFNRLQVQHLAGIIRQAKMLAEGEEIQEGVRLTQECINEMLEIEGPGDFSPDDFERECAV